MITLTIELSQTPDLPNQWMSQCLELDIISAALSPELALEAVASAVRMTVQHEMKRRGMTAVEVFAEIAAEVAARRPVLGRENPGYVAFFKAFDK